MIEYIGKLIVIIGGIFSIIGAVGILRMPDPYNRIHSQTVGVVGGTILIIIGAIVIEGTQTHVIKLVLIALLIFITNPVGSHAIARSAHKSGIKPAPKTLRDDLEEESK
ncbi:MAG: monovalent cation/H(+) antiporter subunit G [Candidatus Hadarchaeota archaeon]